MKKILSICILCIALAVALSSCSKDQEIKPIQAPPELANLINKYDLKTLSSADKKTLSENNALIKFKTIQEAEAYLEFLRVQGNKVYPMQISPSTSENESARLEATGTHVINQTVGLKYTFMPLVITARIVYTYCPEKNYFISGNDISSQLTSGLSIGITYDQSPNSVEFPEKTPTRLGFKFAGVFKLGIEITGFPLYVMQPLYASGSFENSVIPTPPTGISCEDLKNPLPPPGGSPGGHGSGSGVGDGGNGPSPGNGGGGGGSGSEPIPLPTDFPAPKKPKPGGGKYSPPPKPKGPVIPVVA